MSGLCSFLWNEWASGGKAVRREFIFLVTSGFFLLVLFLFSYFFVSPSGFRLATDFPFNLKMLEIFIHAATIYFIYLWWTLRSSKALSNRSFYALVLFFFLLTACVALLTPPTRSQDMYWNLSYGRLYSQYGLNPYINTLKQIPTEPLLINVFDRWEGVPMIYGPLFALFMGLITSVSDSLLVTFVLLKFLYAALFASIIFLTWNILNYHIQSLIKKRIIIAAVLLNPVVIQHLLVDVHNDIFVVFSVVAGYWFFLKKRYVHSIFVLGIGGFFKYIPWMLMAIPLWYYVGESSNKKIALRNAIIFLVFLVVCGVILYIPFGLSSGIFTGVTRQLGDNNNRLSMLPGALFIDLIFSPKPIVMQVAGLVLGVFVLVVFLYKRRPLLAFTLPFAAMFFFTTMWFQSWYVLWIFFILAAYVSFEVLLLVSVFMLYVSDFGEATLVFILAFFLGIYLWLGPRLVGIIEGFFERRKARIACREFDKVNK